MPPRFNSIIPSDLSPGVSRWVRVLCVGLCAPIWVACTHLNVPRADSYPETSQQKARAVHHWDVLADDVAQRIQTKTTQTGAAEPAVPGYHLLPATVSPFHRAFADLLLTRLVNRDVPMSTLPKVGDAPAGIIRFDVQVVQHGSMGFNTPAMPLTVLASGLSVLRNMWVTPPTEAMVAAVAIGASMITDVADFNISGSATGGPTRTEVLVSTTVEHGQRIVARTSDIYYIDPDDAKLFVAPPPPPPPPPPAPTKNWKVVGAP